MAKFKAITLFVLSLLASLAGAVEINLVAPVTGNLWQVGQTVSVSWELVNLTASNGHDLTQIDIDLMRDTADNLVDNISFGVPVGLKTADWIVNAVDTGDNYFVRLTSIEDPKFRLDGPKFTISNNNSKAASVNPAPPKLAPFSAGWPAYTYFALLSILLLV